MNAKKSTKKPPAAKPAKAKGSAKRTECPPPPAWEADEAETPAARVLAAVAKIEAVNGNPPPPACVPVDPSPVAGGVYAGDFLFAARGILAADGFDLKTVEAAERSFREVAAGRLCLSGEVAAAAAALEIFAGRVATPQGWRNTTERPAPLDELAVRWEVLRWNLLESVAALYRECAEAESGGVDRPTIKRAVESVRPVTPLLDPLRIPKGANLVDFLSPDWVRRGELFGPEALSPDAPAILEAFEKVLEELRNLHALFRAEIYAGDTDAPGEYQATDTADTKSKPKRTRGKNIPKNVEKAVLNWLDVTMDGTVKKADGTDMTGELAADGWRGAFDAFSESDACTARIRKYVGSWPKFKRVVEAARKARAREEQAWRVKSRHGQKK